MMLVGCYTVDLYCDSGLTSGEVRNGRYGMNGHDSRPDTYTGETRAECVTKARARGWRIGKEKTICPVCCAHVIAERETKA